MAMKDMPNTGKVEKRGKMMRMRILMAEAMMMGTLKVARMQVKQVLRRNSGARGSIHSKDGALLRQ